MSKNANEHCQRRHLPPMYNNNNLELHPMPTIHPPTAAQCSKGNLKVLAHPLPRPPREYSYDFLCVVLVLVPVARPARIVAQEANFKDTTGRQAVSQSVSQSVSEQKNCFAFIPLNRIPWIVLSTRSPCPPSTPPAPLLVCTEMQFQRRRGPERVEEGGGGKTTGAERQLGHKE